MSNDRREVSRRLAPAAALAALLSGSGCLVTTDVELADLVGDWTASQAELADPANLNQRIDITSLGWQVTLTIADDGTYELVILEPGAEPDERSGTLVVEHGKDLVLTNVEGRMGEGEVFLEGDQVAFMFDEFAGLTADIYGTGEPIPVTLLLVMERQLLLVMERQ